jgi:bifunctional non-homologous end joining protein LigD
MLASPGDVGDLVGDPPGRWRYERKLDGLRCIAVRDGGDVTLWSRNHLPFTTRFPAVVAALRRLAPGSFVIDGELVAFDDRGRSSFSALQRPTGSDAAAYCAFDLVWLLGRDTTALPLTARQALLTQALGPLDGSPLRLVVGEEGDPAALLAAACRDGWEGLVAKRVDAPYRSGRSPQWRKLKCALRQELVVGGWTEPGGARTGLGALLVGYHDAGVLRFAGRVGTGFDERTLRDLRERLTALEVGASPFLDAGRIKGAHWVRPELVAEVRFTEWTPDGRMRHPSFLGLRPDKDPAEVVREEAPAASAVRRPGAPRRPRG